MTIKQQIQQLPEEVKENVTDMETQRFIPTTAAEIGEEVYSNNTIWWLDTARQINEPQRFVAVQTYADKDPNNFIKVENMRTLFTDQAEYYFVCSSCYIYHSREQWSGSTQSRGNWRERAERECREWETKKGWCEFCDPIFGNGGWR